MAWTSTIPDRGSPAIALRRRPASRVKRASPGLSCGEVDLTTTAGPFDCLPSCHCLLIASPIRRGVLDPNFELPRPAVTRLGGDRPKILIPRLMVLTDRNHSDAPSITRHHTLAEERALI